MSRIPYHHFAIPTKIHLPLLLSLLALTHAFCAAEPAPTTTGPTNVPDPYGLGERLALIDWLRAHEVTIPQSSTQDIHWLRRTYLNILTPDSSASPDTHERDTIVLELWNQHEYVPKDGETTAELQKALEKLDQQKAALTSIARSEPPPQGKMDVDDVSGATNVNNAADHETTGSKNFNSQTVETTNNINKLKDIPHHVAHHIEEILSATRSNGNARNKYELMYNGLTSMSSGAQCRSPILSKRSDQLLQLASLRWASGPGAPHKVLVRDLVNWIRPQYQNLAIDYIYLRYSGTPRDNIPQLPRLIQRMEKSEAPLFLRMLAARRWIKEASLNPESPNDPEFKSISSSVLTDGIQTIDRPPINIAEKELLELMLGQARSIFSPLPIEEQWLEGYGAHVLEKGLQDTWMGSMVLASLSTMRAWKARGRGMAANVPEDAWPVFNKNLREARVHLERAHAIDPMPSNSCLMRIIVAMGLSEGEETVMKWLDRGLVASPDNQDIYNMALEALSPRWGGSELAMIEVGRRGVKTNAYDTLAPMQLLTAINSISNRLHGSVEIRRKYWPELRDVFNSYVSRSQSPYLRRWHLTRMAAYAHNFGFTDEAEEILRGRLRREVEEGALISTVGLTKSVTDMLDAACHDAKYLRLIDGPHPYWTIEYIISE